MADENDVRLRLELEGEDIVAEGLRRTRSGLDNLGPSAKKSTDTATDAIQQMARSADDLGQRLTRAMESPISAAQELSKSFLSRFGVMGLAVGGTVAAVGSLSAAILGLGSQGSGLIDVERGFVGLAGGAERASTILAAMRKGTAETVDDLKLMTEANKLLQAGFKGTAADFETLTTGAQVLSRQGFGSIEQVMSQVDRAFQMGSARRLSLMGITVNTTRAELEYAQAHDISLRSMTQTQKQEAVRAAILDELREKIDQQGVAELSLAQRIQQVLKWMGDFVDEVKKHIAASDAVRNAFVAIQQAFSDAFGADTKSMLESIKDGIDAFAGVVERWGPRVIGFFKEIFDWIQEGYNAVKRYWNALPDWLKAVVIGAAEAAAAGWAISVAFDAASAAVKSAVSPASDLLATVASVATIVSGSQSGFHILKDAGAFKALEAGGVSASKLLAPLRAIGAVFTTTIAEAGVLRGVLAGVVSVITGGLAAIPGWGWAILAVGAAVVALAKHWDIVKAAVDSFRQSSLGKLLEALVQLGFTLQNLFIKAGIQAAITAWNVGLVFMKERLKELSWPLLAVQKLLDTIFGENSLARARSWVGSWLETLTKGVIEADKWLKKLPIMQEPDKPKVGEALPGRKLTDQIPRLASSPVSVSIDAAEAKRREERLDASAKFSAQVREEVMAIIEEGRAMKVTAQAVHDYTASRIKSIEAGKVGVTELQRFIATADKLITAQHALTAEEERAYTLAKQQIKAIQDKGEAQLAAEGVTLEAISTYRLLGYTDEVIAQQIYHVSVPALKAYENGLKAWQEVMEQAAGTEQKLWETSLQNRQRSLDDTLRSLDFEEKAEQRRVLRKAEETGQWWVYNQEQWRITQEFEAKKTAVIEAETMRREKIFEHERLRGLTGIDLDVANIQAQYKDQLRELELQKDRATTDARKAMIQEEIDFLKRQRDIEIDLVKGTQEDILAIMKKRGYQSQATLNEYADAAAREYEKVSTSYQVSIGDQLKAFEAYKNAVTRANYGVTPKALLQEEIRLRAKLLEYLKQLRDAGVISPEAFQQEEDRLKVLKQQESAAARVLAQMDKFTSVLDASARGWSQMAQAADGAMKTVASVMATVTNAVNVAFEDTKMLIKAFTTGGPIEQAIAVMKAAADAVALLWDAFTVSPGEDVQKRVGRNWGTKIGEELGDQIAKVAKDRFGGDRQAAEFASFGDILSAAGGLNTKNVDVFAARFRDMFSMLDVGKFSVQDLTKAINENIGAFIELAETGNSRAFLTIVDTAKQISDRFESGAMNAFEYAKAIQPTLDALANLGTKSETAFNAYMLQAQRMIREFKEGKISAEQANEALNSGISKLAQAAAKNGGIVSQSFLDMAKAAKDAHLDLESLSQFNEAMFSKMASGLTAAVGKLPDVQAKIDEFAKKNKKDADKVTVQDALGLTDKGAWAKAQSEWQGQFDRLSRIALASFSSMVASGKSPLEAIMAIGESIDKLAVSHEKLGLKGNAAFAHLSRLRQLTNENKALVESVGGLNDVFVALANTGSLTQEVMDDMQKEGVDSFRKLTAAGFTENEALSQMVPFLKSVIKAHKERGMVIDEETQKMIDQAQQAGILGEEQMSVVDVLKDGLTEIIKLLGGDVPEAWKKAADEAKKSAEAQKKAADDAAKQAGEQADTTVEGQKEIEDRLRQAREEWRNWGADAEKSAGTAKDGTGLVGSGIDDIANWLRGNKGAWHEWRDTAVDAANDVYEAVKGVSLGHSPGGIKDIVAHLKLAQAQSALFASDMSAHMRVAKSAVDAVKPSLDWSRTGDRVSANVSKHDTPVRVTGVPDGGEPAPATFVMNVDGQTFAQVTVDSLEIGGTPYGRLKSIVRQMGK